MRYYDLRGLRRFESSRSEDREEAEKLLRKRLTAKDAGLQPEAAVGKLTVEEALRDVENDYTTNGKKSLKDVQGKIRLHLLPYFGEHRKMTTVTTAALRAFVVKRQEAEASNAEINRELAVLRRAFNLAIQAGRLLSKPYFPMLKERNTRKGFLEREQIDRVCAVLEATAKADDGRKTAHELAKQLPKTLPGIVVVQIPGEWLADQRQAKDLERLLGRFVNGTTRLTAVVVVWEQWLQGDGQPYAKLLRYRPFVRPGTSQEIARAVHSILAPSTMTFSFGSF